MSNNLSRILSHTCSALLFGASCALSFLALTPRIARAQFVNIPSDSSGANGTFVYGSTDNSNNVVGYYIDGNNVYHGFVYNGAYTSYNDPQAGTASGDGTRVTGVYAGTTVGFYGSPGATHGFVYNGTNYTTLDDPLAGNWTGSNTIISCIAAKASGSGTNIVGQYGLSGVYHGFLYDGSSFTTLDDPLGVNGTYILGIYNNEVVGSYLDSNFVYRGFLYDLTKNPSDPTAWTTLDDPLANHPNSYQGTNIYGVYGDEIDGGYSTSSTSGGSFLYNITTNTWTTLSDPSAGGGPGQSTYATGFSGNAVVGQYVDSNNVTHGFEYFNTPEPGSLALLAGIGITSLLARRRRRRLQSIVGTDSQVLQKLSSVLRSFALVLVGVSAGVGVEANAQGLYVGDYGDFVNGDVRIYSQGGTFLDAFSTVPNGPRGMAVDKAGNVFVATFSGRTVNEYSSSGVYENSFTVQGTVWPTQLAFASNGDLLVGTRGEIDRYTPSGSYLGVFTIADVTDLDQMAVDQNGNVYVVNDGDGLNTISKFASDGAYLGNIGYGVDGVATGANNDVYFDTYNNMTRTFDIDTYDSSGAPLSSFDTGVSSANQIALNSSGNIYMASPNNNAVYEFSPDGTQLGVITAGLDVPTSLVFGPSITATETPEPGPFGMLLSAGFSAAAMLVRRTKKAKGHPPRTRANRHP